MSDVNAPPIEWTWTTAPDMNVKHLIGTFTVSVRERVSYDLIAKCSPRALSNLEAELKEKIEIVLKDEMRKFVGEQK